MDDMDDMDDMEGSSSRGEELRSSECGLQPVVLSPGFSRPAVTVGDGGIHLIIYFSNH